MRRWAPSRRGHLVAMLFAAVGCSSAASPASASPGPISDSPPPHRLATCGGFLEGAVVDREGRLWVMDVTGGRVLEVRRDGACVERASTGGHPNGARLAPDGSIWITDWQGLLSFDPRSASLKRIPLDFGTEGLKGLNDLCFDRRGGLYFTVPGGSDALNPNGRVFYRSPDGALKLVTDRLAYPNGVAVAEDGQTVLVSDFARRSILSMPAVDAVGSMKLTFVFARIDRGIGADGMLPLRGGRLLVADFGSRRLQVFGPDGEALSAIDLPQEAGDWVTNVAVRGEELLITEAKRGEVWRTSLP